MNPKAPLPHLTRRRFVGQTLAAAAVAPLVARFANAADPASPPARKVKLGVVGCGGRGAWIANLFQKNGGYEMHAVADYFQPVADAAGDKLGVDAARRFSGLSGYRRLIESGVEAVALETPPYFIPEHARAAVDAGLHVYMAKPVSPDVPGCLSIKASADKATSNKRVFLVDYQIPTEPSNRKVVEMINAGEIGKVIMLNSHYFAGGFADPAFTENLESRLRKLTWVNDVALGGGYHGNACIHAVDAAMWVAGQRPVSCMGVSRVVRADPHGDSHDALELIFEYANGIMHSHRGEHLNNRLGFDVACQIVGTTGHAQIGYTGKAFVKGNENGFTGDVDPNLYEAGASSNIAKFRRAVTENNFANETVERAVDSALATILGREAGMRRVKLTMAELLKENKRLEMDLKGLKS
jgi:myo-inositol 2-dehydrogenase / D-chiro-inositol 1-dehydrogenase